MYHLEISPFGKYEQFMFTNANSGNRFSILPKFGATVLEIVFNGKNIIEGYQTPEDLSDNGWKKAVSSLRLPIACEMENTNGRANPTNFPSTMK